MDWERNDSHKKLFLPVYASRAVFAYLVVYSMGPRDHFLVFLRVVVCNLSFIYLSHDPVLILRKLIDHVRSGPVEIVLDKPLGFPFDPCDFKDFLQDLQSNETITTVTCASQLQLRVSEDRWLRLVMTLGSIKGIEHLTLRCTHGSCYFHPFRAIAEAVNNAHSLRKLEISQYARFFPKDPSGMIALASALRDHSTLQEFIWTDLCSRLETVQITALDPVLRALPACPHLQKVTIMTKYASSNATKQLLKLRPATDLRLVLAREDWLAVTNEIRQGRCNVQRLTLSMVQCPRSEATEAVKAAASAIRLDQNLKHLTLQIESGFTDEAGTALAETLTVNKTLRKVRLFVKPVYASRNAHINRATLGAQSYEAFSAMLRSYTGLVLRLPRIEPAGGADERLFDSHNQMIIEQRLNQVGRGRLLASSNYKTREEWVDALHKLSTNCALKDSSAFRVSCLYSLLRLHPAVIS